MTTIDLATATPRDFDTHLAKVYNQQQTHLTTMDRALSRMRNNLPDRARGLDDAEVVVATILNADDTTRMAYQRREDRTNVDRYQTAREAAHDLATQIDDADTTFRSRGGWSRFFLVQGPGGHIHSSMNCFTCRATTVFAWLPEVSGKTEAEAVAEHGAILCTVCFPTAPTEWTNHWDLEAQRKQAASCSGSGTFDWVEGTTRFGYAAGNGGTCSHCDGYAAATASRKIRKHKPGQ